MNFSSALKNFWWLIVILGIVLTVFLSAAIFGHLHDKELKAQKLNEMYSQKNYSEEPEIPEEQQIEKTPYPILSLPFSPEDLPDSMVPMGETIAHPDPPNPGGHPGIDFQWYNRTVKILASMDGIVYAIVDNGNNHSFDFSIKNGSWGVDCGLSYVNPDIKVGQQIKRGDFIGYASGHPTAELRAKEPNFRMIHWQFGYARLEPGTVERRLCPMNYFDNTSRQLLENFWATIPNDDTFKSQFPYICSGYYTGRDK